jgi:hypothetical protein
MAAGNTYTPLATQTLGSAAASVTFSSISGAYTDLVLVLNIKSTSSNYPTMILNSDVIVVFILLQPLKVTAQQQHQGVT